MKFKGFCLPANKRPVHFPASGPGKVNMVHSLGELNFKKFITFVIGFKIIWVLSTLILTKHSSVCHVVWNLKIQLTGCILLILVYCGTNNLVISSQAQKIKYSHIWTHNTTALWQTHEEQLSLFIQPVNDDNFLAKNWYLKGSSHLDILNFLYCNIVLWGYLKMLHKRAARTTEQLKICITDEAEDTSLKVNSVFL